MIRPISINFFAPDIAGLHQRLSREGVSVEPLNAYPDIKFFKVKGPDGHQLAACWFPEK